MASMSFRNRLVSRRSVVRGVAAWCTALAGVRFGARSGSAATRVVYRFDPAGSNSCSTCKACLRHAEHARYASLGDALAHRPHVGCRCAVIAEAVSGDEFEMMFNRPGTAGHGWHYDRRWDAGVVRGGGG